MAYTAGSMGVGVDDTYLFDLDVLCSSTVSELGQVGLNAFIRGAGGKSIRQAVYASRNQATGDAFGLVHCKARVLGWSGYGNSFVAASIDHVGAVVRLQVIVSATEEISDPEVIQAAVKATLEAQIPGVTCYDTVPSVPNLPAIVVIPRSADFE